MWATFRSASSVQDQRVRLADVLALKNREAPTQAALEELRADMEDLMGNGL